MYDCDFSIAINGVRRKIIVEPTHCDIVNFNHHDSAEAAICVAFTIHSRTHKEQSFVHVLAEYDDDIIEVGRSCQQANEITDYGQLPKTDTTKLT